MPAAVLVVDDHPSIAETIARVLRDDGFTVRVARDGAEALGVLETVAVDLVLSDVVMPVLDGPALLAELHRRGNAVPVVLTSATAGPWVLDGGAAGFLHKPFGIDELLAAVQAAFSVTQ